MNSIKYLIIAVFVILISNLFSCNTYEKSPQIKREPHSLEKVKDTNVIIPPSWAFGHMYGAYTNQEQSIELVEEIISHDYPIDAFWIDSWIWDWQNEGRGPDKYMDFVADTISYPDMEEMWSFLEKKNIKAGMWMWDCILKTGNEKIYKDFKSRNFFKKEYINTNSWHNGGQTTIRNDQSEQVQGTWCGDIDFENPQAVAYFKQKASHFFEKGLDFIKLDKTDDIPVVKAMFEMSQQYGKETEGRGFVLSHSHGVENEEYKRYPAKWTDDTRSDWSAKNHTRKFQPWIPKVGLKENIEMYTDLTRHFHEIPFLANDMGGFALSEDKYIDEELYIRWLQFATFIPLTTPFSQPENESGNIPFKVSKRADTIFHKYSHLKQELFPYIYSYAHKSRLDGINTIRPILGNLYTYHYGDEFLIAPIFEKNSKSRIVEFPQHFDYINFWNGKEYRGGEKVLVEAPIDRMPVFVKKGAIIPKRKYARSIEAGTNDILELHLYPGNDGTFDLIEDDGTSNDYLEGIYALTNMAIKNNEKGFSLEISPAKGFYKGMGDKRTWEIFIHTTKPFSQILINNAEQKFEEKRNLLKVEPFTGSKAISLKVEVK